MMNASYPGGRSRPLAYEDVLSRLRRLEGRPASVEVLGGGRSGAGIALACEGALALHELGRGPTSPLIVEVGEARVLLSEAGVAEAWSAGPAGVGVRLAGGAELEVDLLTCFD